MQSNPVFVREIKPTSNPDMKTVVFEQDAPRPVNDIGSLLAFANAGNPLFGPNTQKRIAFFNFSPAMIQELGLVVGQPVNPELKATLVVHEFCDGDIIPEEVKGYYGGADNFHPRSWKVNEGTPLERTEVKSPKMTPKMEGRAQQVLTFGGKPIYRETHLAMLDMVKADILIKHDNQVTGTSNAIRNAGMQQRTLV